MENEIDSIIYMRKAIELNMDPTWVHIFPLAAPGYYAMFYSVDSMPNNTPMVSVGPQDFSGYASIFDICYKLLADYKTKYLDAQV